MPKKQNRSSCANTLFWLKMPQCQNAWIRKPLHVLGTYHSNSLCAIFMPETMKCPSGLYPPTCVHTTTKYGKKITSQSGCLAPCMENTHYPWHSYQVYRKIRGRSLNPSTSCAFPAIALHDGAMLPACLIFLIHLLYKFSMLWGPFCFWHVCKWEKKGTWVLCLEQNCFHRGMIGPGHLLLASQKAGCLCRSPRYIK